MPADSPADSFRLDEDGVYRCERLREIPWLDHGFGTRQSSPAAAITLRQIHSAIVHNAAGLSDRAEEGDALITNEVSMAIGVRTADCVPILLVDCESRAIAAVHAGWRGLAAEIVRVTIDRMAAHFHAKPESICAAIGPCIGVCCYEVGAEVACRFSAYFPRLAQAEIPVRLDLAEANRLQLLAAGLSTANVLISGLCTVCTPGTLFSYRREPQNPGRMIAAICRRS